MKQILLFVIMVITIPTYGQISFKLQRELLNIYKLDQDRPISPADSDFFKKWNEQNRIDSLNMIRVAAIIDSIGYPGKSLVGDTAYMAAFLVIQHSNLEYQEKYLPIIQDAANRKEIEWRYVAMMIDRIKVGKHEKQIYGTQLQCIKDPTTRFCTDKAEFCPIEDQKNVNLRRQKVGLLPIEDYAKEFGIEYK